MIPHVHGEQAPRWDEFEYEVLGDGGEFRLRCGQRRQRGSRSLDKRAFITAVTDSEPDPTLDQQIFNRSMTVVSDAAVIVETIPQPAGRVLSG